ncbi:MAG: dethiobiotin synthase [Oleibacter sp.]|nr:dethiobiotin synthase [Thalassolituus sp.]
MSASFFLTGTDTDVGKTLVSAALLQRAQLNQQLAIGLKPIASGCDWQDGELKNRDALLHQRYSNPSLPYATHNHFAFEPAIAPHIAAQQAHCSVSVAGIVEACQTGLNTNADFHLIEGAGGWLVPLNRHETFADAAVALGFPVILVVGLRLGCINHACLTAQAIRASGLSIAGWVANCVDPNMAVQSDNLKYLQNWFTAQHIPHLGSLPHIPQLDPFCSDTMTALAKHLHWPD